MCAKSKERGEQERERERERLCVVLFIYAASAAVFVLHSLRRRGVTLRLFFALFCSSLILY